jgi:polar amino acid transport system permease protein/polar amino acid transport system substrate-binding protein
MSKNKHLRNLLIALIAVAVVVVVVGAVLVIDKLTNKASADIDIEDAQTLVDQTLDALPNNVATSAKYIRSRTKVTVTDIDYGTQKDIRLSCTYETVDVYNTISSNINEVLNIDIYDGNTKKPKNATKVQLEVGSKVQQLLETAPVLTGTVDIYLYETENGLMMYLSDEVVNTVFGGILSARDVVSNTNTLTINGETVDISNRNSLRNGFIACFNLTNYNSAKPDTSSRIQRAWNEFKDEFNRNFIVENRWMYLAKGLGNTLLITAFALILGVVIGFIVAAIRCTSAKTGKLKILNAICKVYLAVMRGTPVMIQLLIIYFVILLPLNVDKFIAAVLCFGINSGAYVSEIMRGGIMSIDEGQTEAGRSLGLGYASTMWHIVIPQAFKAILPSLANEFIALLKETSVAFYIGVADLTLGGLKIRAITYSNFMPLIAIAVIYLILVLGLSYLVSLLERRLRKSEK